MKTAIIFGITGQDGAYLAQHLINQDYNVIGVSPRRSSDNLWRLRYMQIDPEKINLMSGDITCAASVTNIIGMVQPDEIYNLAAQSFVAESFHSPGSTFEINAIGVINILEAIRRHSPKTKLYQASTSEMFGLTHPEGQDEDTPFHPRSPYGVAKAAAHYAVQNYREAYGIYACSGILFNHESPLRGEEFVTRKVTMAVARIKAGLQKELLLGNIDTKRDWGHAKDYVKAMHVMLQQNEPEDFVIATGKSHTVRDMVALAFDVAGLNPDGYVGTDKGLYRPSDVPLLLGSPAKAAVKLGWHATIQFEDLITEMVKADIERTNV